MAGIVDHDLPVVDQLVSCAAQQKQFDAFRLEYNTERPHDALGVDTPASRYATSPRPYPERLPTPEYPGRFLVKRVTDAGTSRFQYGCCTSRTRG